jgi:hypothetical protein
MCIQSIQSIQSNIHIHIYTHTHIYIYTHTHIHSYTHTLTHIYTHKVTLITYIYDLLGASVTDENIVVVTTDPDIDITSYVSGNAYYNTSLYLSLPNNT